MEKKEYIEEVFSKAFENFQVPAGPGAWAGIQAGVAASKAGAVAGASAGSTILGKLGLAAVIAGSVALVTVQEIQLHKAQSQQEIITVDAEENVQNEPLQQVTKLEKAEETKITGNESKSVSATVLKKEKSHSFPPEVERAFEQHAKTSSANNDQKISNISAETSANEGAKSAPVAKQDKPQQVVNAIDNKVSTSTRKIQNAPPVPLEAALNANPQGGPTPLDVHLTVQANKEISRINWDFGDGTRNLGNKEVYHTYEFPGEYHVTAHIMDEDGEEVVLTEWVNVREREQAKQPKSTLELPEDAGSGFLLTPNGDGFHDEFSLTKVSNLREFRITIFSQSGAMVYESHDPNFKWTGRDRSGKIVPQGTYYFQILAVGTDEQPFSLKKFITVR